MEKEGEMKNIKRRFSAVLMALVLGLTMIPTVVQAAVNAPKTVTMYRTTGGNSYNYVSVHVSGLSSKQKIAKSSVKVSDRKVLVPDGVSHWHNSSTREYFNGQKTHVQNDYSAEMEFFAKKAGTSKITYKIGSKTYTTTVKVLNYTNPISSMTISGVKTNLASKFKASNMGSAKLASSPSSGKITVKAATGWKISNIVLSNSAYTFSRSASSYAKPASALTLYTGALKKNAGYQISVDLINTKTGGRQYLSLDLI